MLADCRDETLVWAAEVVVAAVAMSAVEAS